MIKELKVKKLYFVGISYWNPMINDGMPNASDFPSDFFTDLEEAQHAFEKIKEECAESDNLCNKPYLLEWNLTTNKKVLVAGKLN